MVICANHVVIGVEGIPLSWRCCRLHLGLRSWSSTESGRATNASAYLAPAMPSPPTFRGAEVWWRAGDMAPSHWSSPDGEPGTWLLLIGLHVWWMCSMARSRGRSSLVAWRSVCTVFFDAGFYSISPWLLCFLVVFLLWVTRTGLPRLRNCPTMVRFPMSIDKVRTARASSRSAIFAYMFSC
jgi:hypothetical protein